MTKSAIVLAAVMAAALLWANVPGRTLPENTLADRIVVEKSARRLTLYRGGAALKSYRVSLGGEPRGAKQCAGDNKTPEGLYTIDSRKGDSAYHRALHVSYPSEADRVRAAAMNASPGGDIMIHGLPNGMRYVGRFQRFHDWTAGCIALTDNEIDELWCAVNVGTRVEIRP